MTVFFQTVLISRAQPFDLVGGHDVRPSNLIQLFLAGSCEIESVPILVWSLYEIMGELLSAKMLLRRHCAWHSHVIFSAKRRILLGSPSGIIF